MNWWFVIYLSIMLIRLLYNTIEQAKTGDYDDNIPVLGFIIVATFHVFMVYMAVKQGF